MVGIRLPFVPECRPDGVRRSTKICHEIGVGPAIAIAGFGRRVPQPAVDPIQMELVEDRAVEQQGVLLATLGITGYLLLAPFDDNGEIGTASDHGGRKPQTSKRTRLAFHNPLIGGG